MNTKKKIALILSSLIAISSFAACNKDGGGEETTTTTASNGDSTTTTTASEGADTTASEGNGADTTDVGSHAGVELTVFTQWAGGDDSEAQWIAARDSWKSKSGATINDISQKQEKEVTTKIDNDFSMGAEGDVYFALAGAETSNFTDKLIPIDTIVAEFPEYGVNMKSGMFPTGPDGKNYALPMWGMWEGLFANKAILTEASVEVPGASTTWDQFLDACEKVKGVGKTPITVSLSAEPHYWFEFTILNNQTDLKNHKRLPTLEGGDAASVAWAAGFTDIKELYEKGYLNENTDTIKPPDAIKVMRDGNAAFYIDGHWARNGLVFEPDSNPQVKTAASDDINVTYVPGKNARKATDIISGISSGWMITKKAWDDPAKRAAAVSLVEFMTSNDTIASFPAAKGVTTALIDTSMLVPEDPHPTQVQAMDMVANATSGTFPIQDSLQPAQKDEAMGNVLVPIAKGTLTPEDAVKQIMSK